MGTHGKVDLLIPSPVQAAGVTKPTVLEASSLAASFVAGAKLPAVPLAMSAPERPDAIIKSIRVFAGAGARPEPEERGVHSATRPRQNWLNNHSTVSRTVLISPVANQPRTWLGLGLGWGQGWG